MSYRSTDAIRGSEGVDDSSSWSWSSVNKRTEMSGDISRSSGAMPASTDPGMSINV